MRRQSFVLNVRTMVLVGALAAVFPAPSLTWAGEADDLQRMIDGSRQRAVDLERLDELKAAREDITALRKWLDEAWVLRGEGKYDEVRVVLDRCDAQADMIRERISAAVLLADAAKKEAALKRVNKDVVTTKDALRTAQAQKAALQAKVGK
jgi:hypothetical protein